MSARATMVLARERRESRGAHQRSDFPDTDDAGLRRNLTWATDGTVGSREIPAAPRAVTELATELGVASRLLE